jgi:hypothetical protein
VVRRPHQESHLPGREHDEELEIIVTIDETIPCPPSTSGCGANKPTRSWVSSPHICRGFIASAHPLTKKNRPISRVFQKAHSGGGI